MFVLAVLFVVAAGLSPVRSQDVPPAFPTNPANRLDQPVNFTCPDGHAIAHVEVLTNFPKF
jgi:hypothetical protein